MRRVCEGRRPGPLQRRKWLCGAMNTTEPHSLISEERLLGLAAAALQRLGMEPSEARDASRILVLADLFASLIDTARLGAPNWLASRVAEFCEILHSTPRADANHPVLVPGEIELARLERQRRDGILLDESVVLELKRLAAP